MKIRCLTLHQPWASLIAYGFKTYETRGHFTRQLEPLAIHAASVGTRKQLAFWDCLRADFKEVRAAMPFEFTELPFGAIVGVVNVISCCSTEMLDLAKMPWLELRVGDYSPGRYAWKLKLEGRLQRPFTTPGHQRFWYIDLPEDQKQWHQEFMAEFTKPDADSSRNTQHRSH